MEEVHADHAQCGKYESENDKELFQYVLCVLQYRKAEKMAVRKRRGKTYVPTSSHKWSFNSQSALI